MLRSLVDDAAPPRTVSELVARYLDHVHRNYPTREGHRSSSLTNARDSMRPLLEVCGDLPLGAVGAIELRAVQTWMIAGGSTGQPLGRRTINDRIARIRRMYRWAAQQGHPETGNWVPAEIIEVLSIDGLRKGRSAAKETPRKRAVSIENLVRTLRDPQLGPTIKDMIRAQLRTGLRPAEVCELRGLDIDTTESPWVFQPPAHKMAYLERERVVLLGPRAQLILLPYMRDGFLFVTSKGPRKGQPYRVSSYRQEIIRACDRMGVPRWSPQQIRKRTATEAAKVSETAARDILGHADVKTTRLHYIDARHSKDAQAFVASFG